MAINNSGDWRDLFDLALFEPNRTKLRQCIEHARHAINDRLDFLTQDPERKRKNFFGTHCTH